MKSAVRILFFLILAVCFSCEEKGWFADCSECTTYEPETADLIIKTSEAETNAIIKIYEGGIEDSILYASFISWGSVTNYQIVLNKKYSVTATYSIDGNTYLAIDSATPRVRYTDDQCDEPCYFIYDHVVDLRLKYTAKK